MNKNLNSKSKTAVIWDLSGAFVRQFVSLFITILLARLLGPEEFGIIGMALVFIHISQVFTDAGFTSGLIQQKDTKDITYSSIFFVNLGISIVLSLVIIATAGIIADFYEEPQIKEILFYLALIPPIAALGKVQDAILTKSIDFKSLTIRSLVATLVGGVLGVTAAFLDFGVYSLVIQQTTMALTATIMLWVATKWRPRIEFSYVEVKKLFAFSSYVFFDRLLRQVANKVDTIFIAKVFSPVVLGFYSRAETLVSQAQTYTTSSLSRVIFPMLSKLQDDDELFKATYFRAFNIVTGLIVLLVAPLYFLSHFIVVLLLGEEWIPTAEIFQILILTTICSPQINMMGRAILAKGYSKLKFKLGLLQRLFKLLPIPIGLYFGIQEFAMAMVVSVILVFIMLSYFHQTKLSIDFWKQIKGFLVPNIPFIGLIIAHYFLKETISEWVFAGAFFAIQILYMKALQHDSYLFAINNIRKIIQRKKAK